MTKPGPKKNVAASVRDRLMQLARTRREDFNFILTRYAMERLLYRLSTSPHERLFVLKGAILFTVWSGHPHRATKDIDLLGVGAPDLDRLASIFRDVCDVRAEDDGVVFDAASVTATRIKEDASYEGVRVLLRGKIGSAVLNLQIDVGFGDAVTPAPVVAEFPVLLGSPSPRLRVYPRETVVAEKLEAMVQLGIANSRMKDFFDLRFLARSFDFDGHALTGAIAATFERRRTPIPPADPLAFTRTFTEDPQKMAQWMGFMNRVGVVEKGLTLPVAVDEIRAFLQEPLEALRGGVSFARRWSAGRWS
ncbi:nucleotidyl transferase AbiEii/AbiGii toxin family protein [bacterium]|nr:MAG: nucleotidyl transferase AbiEii/AbiGii toxin family protein [bacterium]